MKTTLLKSREGYEIWSVAVDRAEWFVVRFERRRARLFKSVADAEALFADLLGRARVARAH